jgi:hypothetical protein
VRVFGYGAEEGRRLTVASNDQLIYLSLSQDEGEEEDGKETLKTCY